MTNRVQDGFGFYGIVSRPVKGYEFLTQLLADYGVAFIQLRMKHADKSSVIKTAERMRSITEKSESRLIINDYPDVALAVDACGVHLGQKDMPVEKARELLGPDKIIGLSTHSPEQTRDACRRNPDYIGVGPVFPTPTKAVPDPVIGLDGLSAMLALATVPAVAIGAVDRTSLDRVLSAGARNFCSVRPLNLSEDPETELRGLLDTWKALKNV